MRIYIVMKCVSDQYGKYEPVVAFTDKDDARNYIMVNDLYATISDIELFTPVSEEPDSEVMERLFVGRRVEVVQSSKDLELDDELQKYLGEMGVILSLAVAPYSTYHLPDCYWNIMLDTGEVISAFPGINLLLLKD